MQRANGAKDGKIAEKAKISVKYSCFSAEI
jgi:hypothetical protein